MEWNLLNKTTFWVEDIELKEADLGKVAEAVVKALSLQPNELMAWTYGQG